MSRRARFLLFAAASASLGIPANLRAALTYNFSNPSAWTLSNGVVNLTFDATTGTFTNISATLGGTDYSIVNSSFPMPNLNHGSPTAALYAQDNGGGVAGSYNYSIGSNYIDIWEDDPPTNTQTPGLDIQSHYVLEDNTAGISVYTVVNHSATAQAVTGYGGDFVIKTSDLNLTQLDYTNYNVNNLGAFQANFPSLYAQAAAAAVTGRNVQNETIDYNGFTYDGQDIQSQIDEAYEMANGASGTVNRQFITKYDYATAAQFEQADGYVGSDGLGVWSVYPSTESLTGGPDDVNIMGVSSGPMETLGWASNHLGGATYNPPTGVNSTRMFGPFYIGFNAMPGTDLTSNLSDATSLYNNEVEQIPSLNSFYDTESELVSSGYVPSTQRGDVTATASTPGGWSSNPYGNLVILADNDTNFQNSDLGDEYWGYINSATDQVSIPGVVPGTYRLSIVELGQWGETRLNNVPVNANLNTILQGVKFTPENFGTSIWTIGTPDRSSQEFEYGNVGNGGPANNNYLGAYDYWGGLANSPVPGAVVYYATAVGNIPATNNLNDWPFNYWQTFDPALYAGVFTNGADTTDDGYNYVVEQTAPYVDANGQSPATYKGPDWQVHFTVTQAQLNLGKYLDLSVGLVAAESSLIVALNGHSLTWHYANLPADDPMERSGTTGYYQWIVYQWDTSDLNPAGQDDELTFGLSQGDGVMWDALRMEISATGANPTTTDWHDYEFLYDSTDTPVNDALSANNGGRAVTIAQTADESAWNLNGPGSWGVASNWSNDIIPQSAQDIADFTGAIMAPTTITLDGNRTAGQINFNNTYSYTIAAGSGGSLILDNGANPAAITDAGGSHFITAPVIVNSNTSLDVQNPTDDLTISGPISGNGDVLISGNGTVTFSGSNTYGGATSITDGTLLIAAPGALPAASSILNNSNLSIQAGTAGSPVIAGQLAGSGTLTVGTALSPAYLRIAAGSGTVSQSSLVINPQSTLDLTNNVLTINYTAGNDPATMVRGYLQTGYNGGTWTGSGIISSNAAVNPGLYAIGYADGNTDVGTPAAANQILIETALAGDANLDGVVNFSDLLIVAQDFGRTGQDWAQGDFNYDGIVNFSDLLLVAQNFGKQLSAGQLSELPGSFTAEWQLAQAEVSASNVPEPASAGLFIVGAAAILSRRRRTRKI